MMKDKKEERERGELERRDGVEEEIDPRDLSGGSLLGVIRRESIRNGARSVV